MAADLEMPRARGSAIASGAFVAAGIYRVAVSPEYWIIGWARRRALTRLARAVGTIAK